MIGCVFLLCVIKSIEEVIVKEISVRECGMDRRIILRLSVTEVTAFFQVVEVCCVNKL